MIVLDYLVNSNDDLKNGDQTTNQMSEFRLSYHPHMLESFKDLVSQAFPKQIKYEIYGDFKKLDEIEDPGFYIHVVQKGR